MVAVAIGNSNPHGDIPARHTVRHGRNSGETGASWVMTVQMNIPTKIPSLVIYGM